MAELKTDILIVGGGVGGWRRRWCVFPRFRVVLTEETNWLGGQLTSQGVPPDEHKWIEKFGCTNGSRVSRRRAFQYYEIALPPQRRRRRTTQPQSRRRHLSQSSAPRAARRGRGARADDAPGREPKRCDDTPRHKPIAAHIEGDRVAAA